MISRTRKGQETIVIDSMTAAYEAEQHLMKSPDTFPLSGGLVDFKMGSELLDETTAEPTLDRWLDNSPKVGNLIDYPSLVTNLQYKRKMFITAEQKKKEPKTDE